MFCLQEYKQYTNLHNHPEFLSVLKMRNKLTQDWREQKMKVFESVRATAYTPSPSTAHTNGPLNSYLITTAKSPRELRPHGIAPDNKRFELEAENGIRDQACELNTTAPERDAQIYTAKFVNPRVLKEMPEEHERHIVFQHNKLQQQSRKRIRDNRANKRSLASVPTYKLMGFKNPPQTSAAIKTLVERNDFLAQRTHSLANVTFSPRISHDTNKQKLAATFRVEKQRATSTASINFEDTTLQSIQSPQLTFGHSVTFHPPPSVIKLRLPSETLEEQSSPRLWSEHQQTQNQTNTSPENENKSMQDFRQSLQRIVSHSSHQQIPADYHLLYPLLISSSKSRVVSEGAENSAQVTSTVNYSKYDVSASPHVMRVNDLSPKSFTRKKFICSQHNMFRREPTRKSFVAERYSSRLRLSNQREKAQ